MHHAAWTDVIDKLGTIALALLALYRSEHANRKSSRALALCSMPDCPLKKQQPEQEREGK